MSTRDPVLAGELVRLRPLRPDDLDAAWELLAGRPKILAWLAWDGPRSRAEWAPVFEHWDGGGEFRFAIEESESGRFAGMISVRSADRGGTGDLGYWLGESFHGQGYMTEAVELLVDYAFREEVASALCAWVFVGNEPSKHVLEKAGFHRVRTVRGHHEKHGRPVDEWYYVLLRSDRESASRSTNR